mgnify:FL=1
MLFPAMGWVGTIDYSQSLNDVIAYHDVFEVVRDYQVYLLSIGWNAWYMIEEFLDGAGAATVKLRLATI